MRDYTKFPDKLKGREKIVYDFVLHNPGLSLSKINECIDMSHNTIRDYLILLSSYGLVDPVKLKQEAIAYYPRMRMARTFEETYKQNKIDFNYRKKQIRKCINSLEGSTHKEGVCAYLWCIKVILSFDGILKFVMSTNKRAKPLKQWLEFQEENKKLLDEVTREMNTTLYGEVLLELEKNSGSIVDELNLFMRKKKH